MEIKPCPFCGGDSEDFFEREGICVVVGIKCLECGAKGETCLVEGYLKNYEEALELAVEWWNRRA